MSGSFIKDDTKVVSIDNSDKSNIKIYLDKKPSNKPVENAIHRIFTFENKVTGTVMGHDEKNSITDIDITNIEKGM